MLPGERAADAAADYAKMRVVIIPSYRSLPVHFAFAYARLRRVACFFATRAADADMLLMVAAADMLCHFGVRYAAPTPCPRASLRQPRAAAITDAYAAADAAAFSLLIPRLF